MLFVALQSLGASPLLPDSNTALDGRHELEGDVPFGEAQAQRHGWTQGERCSESDQLSLSFMLRHSEDQEIKLRGVMSAVGEEKFVGRIRSLAGKIRARDLKEKAPGVSNPFPKRRMSLMAVASSTISSARSIGHSLSSRSPIRSLHSLASTPEAEI